MLGKKYAEYKKKGNPPVRVFMEKYAQDNFQRPFDQLNGHQQTRVWEEIIRSSGRDRPSETRIARILGAAGRALWVVAVGLAFYEIANAEHMGGEAMEQTGVLGGGFLGGAATGALVGGAFGTTGGPVAPVTVGLGVIVGGIAGAFLGEKAMKEMADWIFGPEE